MKYESLFKRYQEQDLKSVFGFFSFDKGIGENWQTPFQQIAEMAKPEPGEWNFQRPEYKKPGVKYPILLSYLNYTFVRLQQQDKIKYVGNKACFNTGLQTPDEKDIFAIFTKSRKPRSGTDFSDWSFDGWFDSYS
ncbi:MAG: DUF3825 domain-containing protein, partial [Desulfoferrobacter sp.]